MDFVFKRSNRKNKKYAVQVDGQNKWIHFGHTSYEQYKDSTPLKLYSHLNHSDEERRANYKRRHDATRHKKYSASWFADRFLW